MDWTTLVVGVITALASFLGVYISNRKNAILVEYRLSQVEKKVDSLSKVDERVYKLETRVDNIERR